MNKMMMSNQSRDSHAAIGESKGIIMSQYDQAADTGSADVTNISVRALQNLIREMYFEKDAERGVDGTFMWLMEEVGELAAALRSGTPEEIRGEFADVIAWLVTIANVVDCDLTVALAEKYGSGCPGCGQFVCTCPDAEKP